MTKVSRYTSGGSRRGDYGGMWAWQGFAPPLGYLHKLGKCSAYVPRYLVIGIYPTGRYGTWIVMQGTPANVIDYRIDTSVKASGHDWLISPIRDARLPT